MDDIFIVPPPPGRYIESSLFVYTWFETCEFVLINSEKYLIEFISKPLHCPIRVCFIDLLLSRLTEIHWAFSLTLNDNELQQLRRLKLFLRSAYCTTKF